MVTPKLFTLLFVAVAAVLGVWIAAASHFPSAEAEPRLRIGTFNTRAVALAYGRSAEHLEYVNERYAAGKKAEAEKRKSELTAIKNEMKEGQRLLDLQVFSYAPIDNILEKMTPGLPEVAKAAGVDAIVTSAVYHAEDVEVVDVTPQMVEYFKPTEETRKMVQDVLKHPPVDPEVAVKH